MGNILSSVLLSKRFRAMVHGLLKFGLLKSISSATFT